MRVAALRFAAVPSLERRLHLALTQHLLHLVNKVGPALYSKPL